jgi:hypothetical protein
MPMINADYDRTTMVEDVELVACFLLEIIAAVLDGAL